jgi:hypothetical protein
MQFLEDINKKTAADVFLFNNCYNNAAMKSSPQDLCDKARDIVDNIYESHIANGSIFSFYGCRFYHAGKSYDMYVCFDALDFKARSNETPYVYRLSI